MTVGNYKVGYKSPPPQHRFKKGQSGNPRGRPRGSKSIDEIVIENLDQRIPIRFNGQDMITTVYDAIMKAQKKKALEGDIGSAKFLTKLRQEAEERLYEQETAIKFMHKEMTRAISLINFDPKAAQKAFDVARIFVESKIKRHEATDDLFIIMQKFIRQMKNPEMTEEGIEEGGEPNPDTAEEEADDS